MLRAEFGKEETFAHALRASGGSIPSLRAKIAEEVGSRQWLEKQVGSVAFVSEVECRNFYEQHRNLFQQPVRFRASHLFLAAHAETPPEVAAEKEDAINALADSMAKGEVFSELGAQNYEDEATTSRAGDANYCSKLRVRAE